MSIRDQGYRPYEGTRTPAATRWRVVLQHALRHTARQPWVIVTLVVAAVPALIASAVLFLAAQASKLTPQLLGVASEGELVTVAARFLCDFQVRWYGVLFFAFAMALLAGGGAIAEDARTGAFDFYFARALSKDQYLAGKLGASLVLALVVCAGPPLLLVATLASVAPPEAAAGGVAWLLALKLLALATVEALAFTLPAVALSSLGARRGFAQATFSALFFAPWILGAIGAGIGRSPWPKLLALPSQLEAIGARIYALEPPADARPLPWLAAAAALSATTAGAFLLARHRVGRLHGDASAQARGGS